MPEDNSKVQFSPSAIQTGEEIKSLKKIISKILSRKYLFIGTFISCFLLAFLYNRYSTPVYRVTSTILIEEDKKSNTTGNDQLLEGFGLLPGMKNFDNQTLVLSSRTLISKTLDVMSCDTEFYSRGFIHQKSIYPDKPLLISSYDGINLPRDVEFEIKYLGKNRFRIKADSEGLIKLDKIALFGDRIDLPHGSFRVILADDGYFEKKNIRSLHFMIHSRRNLVTSYIRRLKIERASKQGSIVKLSLEGTNRLEDLEFLNTLSELFLSISLDRKNNEALRTIQFIDNQLSGISDSLLVTENKLQQFRSRNRVMNLSAQGQVIINQAMNLENEKAKLGIEENYYKYLTEYLEKDSVGEGPIAPATMGISDPGLTKLVADLAEQQTKLYSKGMGEKNPLQNQLIQNVQATKGSLKETLKGLTRANSLASTEIQNQINTVNDQASTLPVTERQLLGIERKYKLNDELYTFLLEKRAMAQMQKASNIADNEIVDYPEYENRPVSPKKPLIYLFAIIAGIGFPFLWLFASDLFNIRIKDINEIEKNAGMPVLGYIPHILAKKATVVLDDPASPVAESFRLLRSRLMFFTKDIKTPVILVTSSMPEEGKTLTAINLASAFSLMGKKTILIGFDLRKPKIFSDFGKTNDKGVSTWLIGQSSLDAIILKTDFENLDLIPSGPIPPNPAELTVLGKTEELFNLLKSRYDCIIVDTSPMGIVSDTIHLISLSDTCIMVVRLNQTITEMFELTLRDLKATRKDNLCLVINDINHVDNRYGYGTKYGYTQTKKQHDRIVKHEIAMSAKKKIRQKSLD
jgi:tyrosine-protein kinase Etk/Wzc